MLDRNAIENLAIRSARMPVYPDPRFPPSLYYRFLYLLATAVQPVYSVELGLCGGGGSLHLALGWPSGKVVGVDVRREYPDNLAHIQQRCSNFEFWETDSVEAAAQAQANSYFPVDILFIDTVHTYEQTLREFNAWKGLFRKGRGSVVVLDDLFREGMLDAWNELPGREKIRLDGLHIGGAPTDGGLGVILT